MLYFSATYETDSGDEDQSDFSDSAAADESGIDRKLQGNKTRWSKHEVVRRKLFNYFIYKLLLLCFKKIGLCPEIPRRSAWRALGLHCPIAEGSDRHTMPAEMDESGESRSDKRTMDERG